MAIIILLLLFFIALIELFLRWLTNSNIPKHTKPRKTAKKFDLLDFDEFADVMDEDEERGQK